MSFGIAAALVIGWIIFAEFVDRQMKSIGSSRTSPTTTSPANSSTPPVALASPSAISPNFERAIPFRGIVSAVDYRARTVTIGGIRLLKILDRTQITVNGAGATLNQLRVQQEIRGSYLKRNDGAFEAKTIIVGSQVNPQPSADTPDALPRPPANVPSYRARLSLKDHFTRDGRDLRNVPNIKASDILLQDRLNFHRFTNGESGDEYDSLYRKMNSEAYRAMFEQRALRVSPAGGERTILYGTPLVEVTINDREIFVQILDNGPTR